MKPYLQPVCLNQAPHSSDTRQADKTGLIAWQGNKYSVPMCYQRARVGVAADSGELMIIDRDSGEIVARHPIKAGKGFIIKNRDHYRDKHAQVTEYEQAIQCLLGETLGQNICQRLKTTSSTIYKDQLAGLKQVLAQQKVIPLALLAEYAQRPQLKVSQIKDYLEIYARTPERLEAKDPPKKRSSSQVARALADYQQLGIDKAKEVAHELH